MANYPDYTSIQAEVPRPFNETDEFRDFMVWLCGYTDRSVPNEADWELLRERTKLIAAKFALQAHDFADRRIRQARLDMEMQRYTVQLQTAGGLTRTEYTLTA
jgi:hypothetical protein